MSINYTYTVINVDPAARCMEIVYESEGRPIQHIGARMPYEGETLEQIVRMYEPVAYWNSLELAVADVAVGSTGSFPPPEPERTLEQAKTEKLAELVAARYAQEIEGVIVGSVRYRTSRESQLQIASINAALQSGAMTTVDWKCENGIFVTHNATTFAEVQTTVMNHVQNAFSRERELSLAVSNAATIEAVDQIRW